jgi:hypothetical protein
MSASDRRAKLDRYHSDLSIRRQCAMLGVSRSGVYRKPRPANDNDPEAMRRIDVLFTARPFFGARRIARTLTEEGFPIERKRVRRLMRLMGIEALGPKPRTSNPAPGHKIYPYLLRNMTIERPNQVWAADITYIPIGPGLPLSGRGHRLGEPGRSLLAALQHDRRLVLPRCAGGSTGQIRQAGDFQHRPRQSVHQRGFHRRVAPGRRAHLDGRARPLDGQRLHRTHLALAQV